MSEKQPYIGLKVLEKEPEIAQVLDAKDSPKIFLPVNRVKPTPKQTKQIPSQPLPRRSPRLHKNDPVQLTTAATSAKKLVFEADSSLDVEEMSGAIGNNLIIIKGGNGTIHYP